MKQKLENMTSPPIKLILCDLGNVLLHFDHRIAVRRIQKFSNKHFDEIHQIFFDSPLTKDFEEGRISPLDFFHQLAKMLELKNIGFDEFAAIWNEIFFENEGMLEILKELKKRYRLHLVSNINELHYRYIQRTFPKHLDVFDKIYCSHEVGRRKPDRLMYCRAIEEAGAGPAEVLYTDDRADLIAEAKKLGMNTILFKNSEDFKKQLKKKKIFF